MRARATIRVARRHGRDELVDRSAEAPLAVRRCGDRAMLTTTAAAPVGGDRLELGITVDAGAVARVGSVAATVAWPSPDGAVSSMRTSATVGERGHLELAAEPTVTVAGSHHRSITRVDLAASATCRIVEEFSLGRSGEPPGTIDLSMRVTREGRPLLHHDEVVGALAAAGTTSVGVGAARHVVSIVVVGVDAVGPSTRVDRAAAGARLALDDDACAVLAAGMDRPTVTRIVAALMADVRSPSPHAGDYGKTIRPIDA